MHTRTCTGAAALAIIAGLFALPATAGAGGWATGTRDDFAAMPRTPARG